MPVDISAEMGFDCKVDIEGIYISRVNTNYELVAEEEVHMGWVIVVNTIEGREYWSKVYSVYRYCRDVVNGIKEKIGQEI